MSERHLFKVVLHYKVCRLTGDPWVDAFACFSHRHGAVDVIREAQAWLIDHGHEHQYVNAYDNGLQTCGRGQVTIVVRDKSVALLLKLSVG